MATKKSRFTNQSKILLFSNLKGTTEIISNTMFLVKFSFVNKSLQLPLNLNRYNIIDGW